MGEKRKLTREYLMSLKEGLYLVSNIMYNSQPYFAEKVAPLNLRKDQWDRIKKADVHQRLCHVFESEKEYTKWRAEINNNEERHKLTREYLMSLKEGLYLVSNSFHNSTQSYFADFAEKVAPLNLRKDQWDRIKKVNAHQSVCIVFKSKKEYTKWLVELNNRINESNKRRMI